jgi:hypothetical protein
MNGLLTFDDQGLELFQAQRLKVLKLLQIDLVKPTPLRPVETDMELKVLSKGEN